LIGAEEHIIKSKLFLCVTSWIKHFREVSSKMKGSGLNDTPNYSQILLIIFFIPSHPIPLLRLASPFTAGALRGDPCSPADSAFKNPRNVKIFG